MKITIVCGAAMRTFKQLAEGESRDEFRGRAYAAMNMPEGAVYFGFEDDRGACLPGPVGEHCHGMQRVHKVYGQDDRLPGLFVLVDGTVYNYRDTSRETPLAGKKGPRGPAQRMLDAAYPPEGGAR